MEAKIGLDIASEENGKRVREWISEVGFPYFESEADINACSSCILVTDKGILSHFVEKSTSSSIRAVLFIVENTNVFGLGYLTAKNFLFDTIFETYEKDEFLFRLNQLVGRLDIPKQEPIGSASDKVQPFVFAKYPVNSIFRMIGHQSRTLLNGVAGPLQIIRALSEDPSLIEPTRMIDLSVVRFEKFAFRSLLLSNIIGQSVSLSKNNIGIANICKYVTLDLTDISDFYGINIEFDPQAEVTIQSDYNLVYQLITIVIERFIFLSSVNDTLTLEVVQADEVLLYVGIPNAAIVKAIGTAMESENTNDLDVDYLLLREVLKLLGFAVRVNHAKMRVELVFA
ncbi:MAG: hypothetical protein JW783_16360 [Bacteroidales bacterium]|nr:hypothetical protein [Bacteroidales bacterium]MBN2750713.1 hypothetical protein [Bacteroidales bacterium]